MMTRAATSALHISMADAIQLAQARMGDSQRQLASGKKAASFADLETPAVNALSVHSMLGRNQAYGLVGRQLGTTLSLYDASLNALDSGLSELKQTVQTAIGGNNGMGLQSSIETAFDQFSGILNTSEGGGYLFGGSRGLDQPFSPASLTEATGMTDSQAFQSDDARLTARLSDQQSMQYGVGAAAIGTDALHAFRTLSAAGPFGAVLTDTQTAQLKSAIGEIESALTHVRAANAENGRNQARLETITEHNDDRHVLLSDIVSRNEDADLAKVATDLSRQQTVLEASYSIFGQLGQLSLASYLR